MRQWNLYLPLMASSSRCEPLRHRLTGPLQARVQDGGPESTEGDRRGQAGHWPQIWP